MDTKSKLKGWAAWPVENYRIALLLVLIFFCIGIFGLFVMPKDEFPPYTIRFGAVVAAMPGATAEEIEEQIARPLERYVFTFKEVDRAKTTTTSSNGMCFMMVELRNDVKHKDAVWSKIKHGLNSFKAQLPAGMLALVVNEDFGEASAVLITMESSKRTYRDLQGYADELADHFRRIPSTSNVRIYGSVKEQISLYLDRERMAAYGIGQAAIAHALSGQSITVLSGSLTDPDNHITLHVSPTEKSELEIANEIVYSPLGKNVRVCDVAEIRREFDVSDKFIENNGNRSLVLSLEMYPGNNIVDFGRQVDKVLSEFSNSDFIPADVKMTRITDLPQVVGDSVTSFMRDLIISMVIIMLVMVILFPLRSAIVAAATIPVSTFISIGIMYLCNIPLNIMTLACLIVVLGMIVDNSIVVIDGYLEYLGNGMPRRQAAVESVKQYFAPMMLATVCICAIFWPLIFTLVGPEGDVIGQFPPTITINLMVSLAVAVLLIPILNVGIIKKLPSKKPGKKDITDWVQIIYIKTLKWNFKHPWVTIIGAVAIVVATLFILPNLKLRQYPFADRNQFAVEFYLPQGEGLDRTHHIADSLRDILAADPRVTNITSFIGCSSPRFQVTYAPQIGGRNFAQLIVNTPNDQTTLDVLNEYAPKYSNYWPDAYCRFKQMDFLSVPTYEYRFYGTDIDSIVSAAEILMEKMRDIPEIEWIHTDYGDAHPIAEINLDPIASAQLGISRTNVELQLATQTCDLTVGKIWEGDYEVPIILKDQRDDKLTYSDVDHLQVLSTVGPSLPLRQMAQSEPRWVKTNIVHRNGERCISVLAEGKRGVIAQPVQAKIEKILKDMKLPPHVRYQVGGEVEKNSEVVPDIALGLGLALVIIFFFILFNFKRFKITFLCMGAIVLSLPGALIGLGIADRTLGLTSLFGFITLMGIIMRNEILIFEHADNLMQKGWTAKDAAYDAGRRRMVPIFLTTATTAVGVIPMIIAKSSFWMPVGITIFAGGIGTLLLIVTVLPVLYWKLNSSASKSIPNSLETAKRSEESPISKC